MATKYDTLPARVKEQVGMEILARTVESLTYPADLEDRRQQVLRQIALDTDNPVGLGVAVFDLCDDGHWDYFAEGVVAFRTICDGRGTILARWLDALICGKPIRDQGIDSRVLGWIQLLKHSLDTNHPV